MVVQDNLETCGFLAWLFFLVAITKDSLVARGGYTKPWKPGNSKPRRIEAVGRDRKKSAGNKRILRELTSEDGARSLAGTALRGDGHSRMDHLQVGRGKGPRLGLDLVEGVGDRARGLGGGHDGGGVTGGTGGGGADRVAGLNGHE